MALDFQGTTDRVNHGSGATIDNLQTMTAMHWVNVTPANGNRLWQKGTVGAHGTTHLVEMFATVDDISASYSRATASQRAAAVATNFAAYAAGTWMCLGVQLDPTTDGNNRLYLGNLSTPLAEPSAYSVQTAGSGAFNSDAAADLYVGNNQNLSVEFDGVIAWIAWWNRLLTYGEMVDQQFRPHVTSGCVLFTHYGLNGATGTQADWSGNGNNGTLTGTTAAQHVPLRPPFGGFAGWRGNFTAAAAAFTRPIPPLEYQEIRPLVVPVAYY